MRRVTTWIEETTFLTHTHELHVHLTEAGVTNQFVYWKTSVLKYRNTELSFAFLATDCISVNNDFVWIIWTQYTVPI